MTLDEYQAEYERLYRWRELWLRLATKFERGRLQSRQEQIEQRAASANRRIGALINSYDKEQRAPYEDGIRSLAESGTELYRQDIFDRFCTPGHSNSEIVSFAIRELERTGTLVRGTGPCSQHKGPLYRLAPQAGIS